jgi:transposase
MKEPPDGNEVSKVESTIHPDKNYYKCVKIPLKHGLLSCKSCYNVWNRDCNGAKNIYKITSNIINKKDRPSYLQRSSIKKSDVLHDTSKPKFTRLETVKPC